MADLNLKAKVTLQDDASKPLASLKKQLADLLQTQGVVGAAIGATLGGGVTAVAGTLVKLVADGAQAAWELGEMGAQAQRTEASFERLAAGAGASGRAMLAAMEEASRGTVAETDLMAAANRALVLGVADSAEEMGRLVEAAIVRGRDVGVGATQAVNDLVTGIGRMSPQILDNLGIVGAAGAFDEYARSLGVTAEQLTDVQKKQALLNSVLASTEGMSVADDAASSFERMDAAIENMKVDLGELFGPAMAAIADKLAEAVGGIKDAVDASALQATQSSLFQLGNTLNGLMTAYDDAIISMQNAAKAADSPGLKTAAMNAEMLGASIQGVAEEYNRAAAITGAPLIDVEALGQGIVQFVQLGDEMKNAATDAANLEINVIAVANAARGMAAQLRGGFAGRAQALALQAVELGAPLEQVETLLANTVDAINATEIAYDGSTLSLFHNQLAMEENLAGLDGMVDGLTAAQAAAAKFASAGVTQATKALDDLQSSVSSLVGSQLSGALTLDVSWPGQDGARQDDVNENARRLAAIANEGLIGQDWLGEFAQEAPTTYADLMLKIAEGMDAQGAAQLLLGEFQSGLRPDLLNFDMIKQQVKDQLTSQQAIEEMTGELTSQLMAEMGVSADQVQGAMGQLGLTGGALGGGSGGEAVDLSVSGGQAAASFSASFVSGVNVAGMGASLAGRITAEFATSEAKAGLRGSAEAVAAFWSQMFTGQVASDTPGELLSILTDKLLPLMLAALAQQHSTTRPSDGG
jgi:hypothetical protein